MERCSRAAALHSNRSAHEKWGRLSRSKRTRREGLGKDAC
jgi:hypothetical protein